MSFNEESLRALPSTTWYWKTPRVELQRIALFEDGRSIECTATGPTHSENDGASQPKECWIVRDDMHDAFTGGNKSRKLDALWPALVDRDVTDVVTCGGIQSAHNVAVAAMAARSGIRCHVSVRGDKPTEPAGYAVLAQLFANVHWTDRDAYADRDSMLHRLCEVVATNAEREGRRCEVAVIPEGAANVAALLGVARQVLGILDELSRHRSDARSAPIRLIVDSGTGTTAAGLAWGIAALDLPWTVHAVQLMRGRDAEIMGTIEGLWAEAEAAWGTVPSAPADRLRWSSRRPERRFGKLLPAEVTRARLVARTTGVLFDPIYTLAAYDEACRHSEPEHTVIVHTGGSLGWMGIAQRVSIG